MACTQKSKVVYVIYLCLCYLSYVADGRVQETATVYPVNPAVALIGNVLQIVLENRVPMIATVHRVNILP